jgi:hypothetical protein
MISLLNYFNCYYLVFYSHFDIETLNEKDLLYLKYYGLL